MTRGKNSASLEMEKGHLPLDDDDHDDDDDNNRTVEENENEKLRRSLANDRQLEDVRDQKTAHLPLSVASSLSP